MTEENEVIIEQDTIEDNCTVECGIDCSKPDCTVKENCCCEGETVTFDNCQDFSDFTILGDRENNQGIELTCQARFLKIRVCLKNICKGRRLAVGVLICDAVTFKVLGFKGKEVMVPGYKDCCEALNISEFCFVIPDDNICEKRRIKVRIIAHYTDFNPNPGGCPC